MEDRDETVLERLVRVTFELCVVAGGTAEGKVGVSLTAVRAFALNAKPEAMNGLWAYVFTELLHNSMIGHPGLDRLVSQDKFATLAGLKSITLEKLVQQRRIAYFEMEAGRRFPAFQAWRGELLPGLADINQILSSKGVSDATRALFFLWPINGGANVLEMLRNGLVDEAVEFAKGFRGFLF